MTIGQSERILESWPGRSVHFHWFHDPGNPDPDHESNKALDLVYQDAVLNLDYAGLGRRMRDLRSRMAERELRITTPAGTDLRFRTGARFHVNDGDASTGQGGGRRLAARPGGGDPLRRAAHHPLARHGRGHHRAQCRLRLSDHGQWP